MTFGEAINAVKTGAKISREGWNGKEQYVVLANMDACTTINRKTIVDPQHVNIGSKFLLFVGSSGYQVGWLASQSDMLAEDWKIIK